MDKKAVITYISEKKRVSVPELQSKFALGFSEARTAVREMTEAGILAESDDGLHYDFIWNSEKEEKFLGKTKFEKFFKKDKFASHWETLLLKEEESPRDKLRRMKERESEAVIVDEDYDDDDDDDDAEEYKDILRRRRKKIKELCGIGNDDDDDEEDDDDDEDDMRWEEGIFAKAKKPGPSGAEQAKPNGELSALYEYYKVCSNFRQGTELSRRADGNIDLYVDSRYPDEKKYEIVLVKKDAEFALTDSGHTLDYLRAKYADSDDSYKKRIEDVLSSYNIVEDDGCLVMKLADISAVYSSFLHFFAVIERLVYAV